MFADHALACRIEQAECRLTTDVAARISARSDRVFVAPFMGGAAVHVGVDAPFNKLIGPGLHGPPSDEDKLALAEIEREFDARAAPLQVELATLADCSLAKLLTGRGYGLVSFENVLGLRLDEKTVSALRAKTPPDSLFIESCGTSEQEDWIRTVVDGFAHPDSTPSGSHEESFPQEELKQVMRDMSGVAGFARYLARVDGTLAGGGAVRLCDGIAQLCGSATLPALRRRGVQSALLRCRLLSAAQAGCDVAVITTQPGSRSQQNAQRQGFALLYSRAILVRQPRSFLG